MERSDFGRDTGRNPLPDFGAAERDLTPATTADSLMRRGRVRAFLGRFDEAEADFAESLRLSAGNVWAWTWRGNARVAAGDAPAAEAHFTKAIAVNQEFAEAWEGRGHVRLGRRAFAGATKDYEEAIRLNPSLGPILGTKLQEAKGR